MSTSLEAIDAFRGDNRFLSNFWAGDPFTWRDQYWSSAEHAYQAAKCARPEQADRIRLAARPGHAKRLGRQIEMRADWEEVKDGIMADILRHKFQDPELRRRLLATGSVPLIEGNTWGDTYWGVCRGVGQNRLGRLLMRLRRELACEATAQAVPEPQP